MIKPHGSDTLNSLLVTDNQLLQQLLTEAESLPSIVLNSAAAANAVMMGAGYFNPLTGYMNLADSLNVAENLHTEDGLFWPVPVVNLVKDTSAIEGASRIALRDPNTEGNPVMAIMDLAAIETVSFRTAGEIRDEIAERGWQKVVAFQTRNPMHRAHEELCHMAMERLGADGVVVHMLLGKLKQGDIPASVRDDCIRKMVELYFPANSVMVTGYGFDMLYAGPREAVLHAVFRQNMGCTHLIVGRDHAGVGDYYGAFDAQTIFADKVPAGALEIEIFNADHTAFSKKLGRVVMMNEAEDHTKDDFILLSGTKVRQMLGDGIAPPPEFSRPEVAKILMDYYQLENA